ncbi:hypothetical protein RB598_004918 [Gaeumannomyces tritici]
MAGAGYILNAFSLTSATLGVLVGIAIRWTSNVKWAAAAGVAVPGPGHGPARALPQPGLVRRRARHTDMTSTVLAAACSRCAPSWPPWPQSAATRSPWARCCTALFGGIGTAVKQAIAGGLWNKVLPAKPAELLSDEAKPDAAEILGDMVSQMAQGGAMRDAIITTYGQAQHLMVIAGCGFVPPVVSSLLLWRNINVKGRGPIWVMGPKSG